MKKNISINLQGIIFYIEEDGYEQLSAYLASIKAYFSAYEGHEEIIADIEARIAEILASHLAPGKQVITLEDVQKLIAQMGNVNDFEQEDPLQSEATYSASGYSSGTGTGTKTGYETTGTGVPPEPKKLYRDFTNRMISGVSAGIARYLEIDPLWIRLLFVFLLMLAPFTAGISVVFVLAAYIIFWIAMPVKYDMPTSNVKKLFRDPSDKKLGGVASGIAKYLGLDVTLVRILFLASALLGGTGLFIYILLWIVVPEAITLTERMQMQGNPVTLSGIEHFLKENLRFKDQNGEETTAAKVLLLPLRLLAQFFSWLSKVFGPLLLALVNLFRIALGVVLLAASLALMVGLFISLLVATGVIDEQSNLWISDIPVSVYLNSFPRAGLVSGFVVALVPLLLLFILAVSLLAKRFFLRPIAGWSMFAVWLIGVFVLVAFMAMYSQNFRRVGDVEVTRTIPVEVYQTLTLDAYNLDSGYGEITIDIESHNKNYFKVIQRQEARGKTEEDAKRNAQMVSYRVEQRDSVLRFDDSFTFKKGAIYRKQQLNVVVLVPEGKRLRFTEDFLELVPNANFVGSYSRDKIARNIWQAQGDRFICISCASDTLNTPTSSPDFVYQQEPDAVGMGGSVLMSEVEYNDNLKHFNFTGFSSVAANGNYHIQLRQGKTYAVSVRGENNAIDKVRISKNGNELQINPRRSYSFISFFKNEEPLLIQITLPELRTLELSGATKADVVGIRTENLVVRLNGATKSNIDVEARTIKLDATGASKSILTGRVDELNLEMAGASKLDANKLLAGAVKADLAGACKADVYVSRSLRADAAGASKICYRGNPTTITTDVTGASKVVHF